MFHIVFGIFLIALGLMGLLLSYFAGAMSPTGNPPSDVKWLAVFSLVPIGLGILAIWWW